MSDAELARSVLACPTTVELVVEGLPHVGNDDRLSLLECDGIPTFGCLEGSLMAQAGDDRRAALITLDSGLGPAAGPDRGVRVALSGRLRTRSVESCRCCAEVRHTVTLGLDLVVLTRRAQAPVVVELESFLDSGLALNQGHLQRALDHANRCHQDELRHTVARLADLSVREVGGVGLTDLTPVGVDVSWLDQSGAHRFRVDFDRPATTQQELGELLRGRLHAGIC